MDRFAWNKTLDNYLMTGKMSSDDYEELDIEQQFVIQEIKKAMKRLKAKHEPEINI